MYLLRSTWFREGPALGVVSEARKVADAMRLHLPGLCLRSFASVHLWGGGCPRNKFWKFVDRGRLSVAYVKALGFRIHPFRISSVNYFIEEFLGFADHKFT